MELGKSWAYFVVIPNIFFKLIYSSIQAGLIIYASLLHLILFFYYLLSFFFMPKYFHEEIKFKPLLHLLILASLINVFYAAPNLRAMVGEWHVDKSREIVTIFRDERNCIDHFKSKIEVMISNGVYALYDVKPIGIKSNLNGDVHVLIESNLINLNGRDYIPSTIRAPGFYKALSEAQEADAKREQGKWILICPMTKSTFSTNMNTEKKTDWPREKDIYTKYYGDIYWRELPDRYSFLRKVKGFLLF